MSDDSSGRQSHTPVTPAEFLAVQRGEGTQDQVLRVQSSIEDPRSELNRWLKDIEQWAERAFSYRNLMSPELVRQRLNRKPSNVIQTVRRFVDEQQARGVFSAEDASAILEAARHRGVDPEADPSQGCPSSQIAAAAAMIEKIVEIRPDLISGIVRPSVSPDR